ncbi:TetR/AcrR family transcriptional regulator [Nocardia caishijiensis]|uniref:TetR family transcriptional regulator n=1 Tax=Nocardia caishijiensis TaxID=184756 RepID=A0ABQ6YHC5_9NOCA|nr:TetR/AcrR family transcriptional regulator [Nocardia caishijiensis]KAF0845197.1 TetR family transcriptional regulator [Nocardia caishijiensis]
MTANPVLGPRALANRQRILAVAGKELLRDPAASMEDIAVAAGMVRRTLYGHFPTREALVDGLREQAFEQVGRALDTIDIQRSPARAIADLTIALWPVGDEFRLLLRLDETQSCVRTTDRLDSVRRVVITLIERGQADGSISDDLPPFAVAAMLVAMVIALLNAKNDGEWAGADAAEVAGRTCLITIGVAREAAVEIARMAAAESAV